MTNTSATGGFLRPTSAPPIEDAALADALQAAIVGITGLHGTLVRPRWQPLPPKQPEPNIDWCGVGILSAAPDENVATIHNGAGDGSSDTIEHLNLSVQASFYGPNCQANANLLRAGLMVAQNREQLSLLGIGLVRKPGEWVRVPDMVSNTWIDRCDLSFVIRRKIVRTWPIENIVSVIGTIKTDTGTPRDEQAVSVVPASP